MTANELWEIMKGQSTKQEQARVAAVSALGENKRLQVQIFIVDVTAVY